MKEVFISYKAEEFDEAHWVKTTLENNGISCWMAPMSIPGGSSYATEIPQAIRGCKVFVLVLSEKAQESKWVPRELDQAINENKTVLPFMLENCALKDDFNFYLTNVQRYAAYESKANAMEKMIREIKAIIGAKNEETSQSPSDDGVSDVPEKPKPEDTPAQKEKKPPKPKKEQKPKNADKKPGKARRVGAVFSVIAAAIVGIVILSVVLSGIFSVRIAGKKYSSGEKYITIRNTELSQKDIDNISKLKKARSITLSGCAISCEDLSGIGQPGLSTLDLSDCGLTKEQIDSINLQGLSELYSLDLSGNPGVYTLDGLLGTSEKLRTLKINNTSVTDISQVAKLSDLTDFAADNDSISDISALASCAKLTSVSLNGNSISDLSPLSGCQKLAKLCVNGNALTSLAGLENCIELETIQAGSNQITNIEGLCNATLLEFVFLNDNMIEDISVLAKSSETLQKLYLKNNKLSGLEALESFAALTHLDIDNNLVASLEPLADSVGLIGLSAADNQLTSIAGIKNKNALEFLNLAGNQIIMEDGDLLSFSTDAWRITLNLAGNNIDSLRTADAYEYRYLGLDGNPITDYKAVYSTKGADLVLDYSEKIDFPALNNAVYSDYRLIGCPLDRQVRITETLGSYCTDFISSEDAADLFGPCIPDTIKGLPEYYK